MHYIVVYDIDKARVAAFERAVQGLGHTQQLTRGAIVICTSVSPEYAYNVLVPCIVATDRFAVLELAQSGQRRGWLAQDSWRWLEQHLGSQHS
jgi:hypothetical protein